MCSDVQNRMGTPHIKMCSDVYTRVGTPHMNICSDVQNRVGASHIKMCSDVRVGTQHMGKCVRKLKIGWGHHT